MDNRQTLNQAEREPEERCAIEAGRRPAIKLPPAPPHIMICVPIGAKSERRSFDVPPCKNEKGEVIENCPCPNHGKTVHTFSRNQGLVPAEWAISLTNIVTPLNTTIGYLMEKGRLSAEARNRMTARCLELGVKYIFYWDDDVVLHPHMLYAAHNILETDPSIGLVTGVYFTREDPTEPFIYRDSGQGAWWGFSIDPEDPPEDIHGCGGGCIMVRAEDVRQMKPPYWTDEMVVHEQNTAMWGHDIRFVKKFREETGKRTVVKGHLLCQHIDVDENRVYEIPPDSKLVTRYRERKEAGPPPMRWAEIQESPALTLDYLDEQLKLSNSRRRMFVVDKNAQSRTQLEEVLSQRFRRVPIHSMDEKWVAICEELIGVNGQ